MGGLWGRVLVGRGRLWLWSLRAVGTSSYGDCEPWFLRAVGRGCSGPWVVVIPLGLHPDRVILSDLSVSYLGSDLDFITFYDLVLSSL